LTKTQKKAILQSAFLNSPKVACRWNFLFRQPPPRKKLMRKLQMLAPSILPPLPSARVLIGRAKTTPVAMHEPTEEIETITVFNTVLDEETSPTEARLDHLIRCVLASRHPVPCLNKLVAWARENRCLPTLRITSFRLLGENKNGRKLSKLLLNKRCAAAAAVLSGPTH